MKWVVLGFWLVVAILALGQVRALIDQLRTVAGVNPTVVGPVPSADQQALQVIVTLIPGSGGWSTISTTIAEIKQIASGVPPGLSMHVTGPGGFAAESSEAFPGVDGKLTGEVVSSTQARSSNEITAVLI